MFPNFLFLAGASLVFSLQSRVQRGESKLNLARGLGRRSLNLLLLHFFVEGLPTFHMRRIRIFGVLFRTALCSLAGGLILLVTLSTSALLAIVSILFGGYYLLLRFPFAGLNRPLLDPDNNVAAWLDRKVAHLFHGQLHTGALYNVTHDPEGLLSSLPALGTVLLGCCAALTMRSGGQSPACKAGSLALSGAVSLMVGHVWDKDFPINKNLWTSSYALAAAGWSLLSLSALYWLYDVKQIQRRSRVARAATLPANIFGANALVAYAVSIAGHTLARSIHVQNQGHSISLRTYGYRRIFARCRSTPLRSLAFAAAYAALCFMPNLFLWRRKIFVKI